MSRRQLALFEPVLLVQALTDAVKINPRQWRNGDVCGLGRQRVTTLLTLRYGNRTNGRAPCLQGWSGLWLWGSAHLPPICRSAGGRPPAKRANSPEGANRVKFRRLRARVMMRADNVPAAELRKSDIVWSKAGDVIPATAGHRRRRLDWIVRLPANPRRRPRVPAAISPSVTGGTRIPATLWLVIACSVNLAKRDRMIAMVEGAQRRENA